MIKLPNLSDHEKLVFMWNVNPTCFWCGKETRIIIRKMPFPHFPKDTAMKNHLFFGDDIRRLAYRNHGTKSPVVLSCCECLKKRDGRTLEEFCKINGREIDLDNGFIFS